jgi:hypothetical protein
VSKLKFEKFTTHWCLFCLHFTLSSGGALLESYWFIFFWKYTAPQLLEWTSQSKIFNLKTIAIFLSYYIELFYIKGYCCEYSKVGGFIVKHYTFIHGYNSIYEWFWLTRFKFCMRPVKNLNFNIIELLSYIAVK